MRTLLGWGRWAQSVFRRGKGGGPVAKVPAVRPLAGGRAPLVDDRLGPQTRGGAKLDQVDGTTCGSAVLVALAAWADPTETRQLDGGEGAARPRGLVRPRGRVRRPLRHAPARGAPGVHQFWPRRWAPRRGGWWRGCAGTRRGRARTACGWSTTATPADLTAVIEAATAALAVGRPVPLLVGAFVPRHYCLALSGERRTPGTSTSPPAARSGSVPLDARAPQRARRPARFRPAVRRAPAVLKMLSVAPRKLDG